jgi:hypothetical protein
MTPSTVSLPPSLRKLGAMRAHVEVHGTPSWIFCMLLAICTPAGASEYEMMKSTLASFILVSCGVISVSFWSKTSGPATTLILASLRSRIAVSRPLCPQPVESCMSPIRWYFFFWM